MKYEIEFQPITALLNLFYGSSGIFLGLLAMYFGYKLMDTLTHFVTAEELEKGNIAVGLQVAGLFVGIGICAGLIIGKALN
jgi:uncharacterized membrane protein YjfL (UPF0719 family)